MRFRHVYSLAAVLTLLLGAVAFAAESKPTWKGSIAVSGDKHSEAQLKKLAKVSKADATKAALAAVPGKSKKIESIELEAEDGYLVYSFDIKVKGQEGIEEVLIDAGNGKVLAREHESAESEANEKKEEAREKKGKGDTEDDDKKGKRK